MIARLSSIAGLIALALCAVAGGAVALESGDVVVTVNRVIYPGQTVPADAVVETRLRQRMAVASQALAGEIVFQRSVDMRDPPVPEAQDLSQRLAAGSGPLNPDGQPLVQPAPERKKPLPRPSLKSILSSELEGDSELDVPTFIRRHNVQG